MSDMPDIKSALHALTEAREDGLSPWHRVAVLLISLGEEAAADVLRQFSQDEVQEIAQAVAELKTIPREKQEQALREFEEELEKPGGGVRGGEDVARGMLEKALGVEEATSRWEQMGKGKRKGFALLDQADASQVAPFIGKQHPQTIALILTQLKSDKAAAILGRLPEATQTDVAHRIATLEGISPDILQQVEEALVDELEDVLSGAQSVEGVRVAADILNRIGTRLEKSVLQNLDAKDPEVAEEIRNRMFTFDDLVRLESRDLVTVLQQVDPNELTVALKSAGKGVLDAVLNTMSERRQQRMLEDLANLPRIRLSEVEEAQMHIVQQARQLDDQGVISLVGGDGDTYV